MGLRIADFGLGGGGVEDGRWEMGDGGRAMASALARNGWETAARSVGPGKRRVRPAGSQVSFFPERRSSWT